MPATIMIFTDKVTRLTRVIDDPRQILDTLSRHWFSPEDERAFELLVEIERLAIDGHLNPGDKPLHDLGLELVLHRLESLDPAPWLTRLRLLQGIRRTDKAAMPLHSRHPLDEAIGRLTRAIQTGK